MRDCGGFPRRGTGIHALADLECLDQVDQAVGIGGERVACCVRFFHHGRIFLSDLVHLADGRIDFVQSGGLFARRGYD